MKYMEKALTQSNEWLEEAILKAEKNIEMFQRICGNPKEIIDSQQSLIAAYKAELARRNSNQKAGA